MAKVNEGELRPSQALLDQPRARIARSPAMPVRHAPQTFFALRRQAHTNDGGTGCWHDPPYVVTLVRIVAIGPTGWLLNLLLIIRPVVIRQNMIWIDDD